MNSYIYIQIYCITRCSLLNRYTNSTIYYDAKSVISNTYERFSGIGNNRNIISSICERIASSTRINP